MRRITKFTFTSVSFINVLTFRATLELLTNNLDRLVVMAPGSGKSRISCAAVSVIKLIKNLIKLLSLSSIQKLTT